ncbi:CDGSH iron-sulfur domain-containing protein [Jeotgalibacillus marinus]|uniref:CDGSH iron-sulfur domain-containing protein n=1 Tax=Jeotgalibacillus marinus TaxID=86667 RepID=A0ABV3Q807_9BACL
MSDAKIKVLDDGPLLVKGDVEITDADGNVFKQKGALCRCGHSKNKPFCDGSHQGTFNSKVHASE